jgi:hypothetical protein
MFDAKLATAILEAPTGFVAHDEGTPRAGEREGCGAKTPIAQRATFAAQGLQQGDAASYEQAEGDGQPLNRRKSPAQKSYPQPQQ